jgi:hypothetical protein
MKLKVTIRREDFVPLPAVSGVEEAAEALGHRCPVERALARLPLVESAAMGKEGVFAIELRNGRRFQGRSSDFAAVVAAYDAGRTPAQEKVELTVEI